MLVSIQVRITARITFKCGIDFWLKCPAMGDIHKSGLTLNFGDLFAGASFLNKMKVGTALLGIVIYVNLGMNWLHRGFSTDWLWNRYIQWSTSAQKADSVATIYLMICTPYFLPKPGVSRGPISTCSWKVPNLEGRCSVKKRYPRGFGIPKKTQK